MNRDERANKERDQHNEERGWTGNTATLKEARQDQTAAIFTAASEYMCIYDPSGQVLHINEQLSALLRLDLIPDYLSLPLHERAALLAMRNEQGLPLPAEQSPLWRVLHGEILRDTETVDVMVRTLQERELYLNISGTPIWDGSGEIIGAILFVQDVSERRAELRKTRRALDTLLSMTEVLTYQQHEPERSDDTLEIAGSSTDAQLQHSASDESLNERQLLELPCQLLNCQRIAIMMLEPENDVLKPLSIVGIAPELEELWWNSLDGARLDNFLGEPDLIRRLKAGEVLALDSSRTRLRDHTAYKVLLPISKGQHLLGVLLMGYGGPKPNITSQELAVMRAIANLSVAFIERERAVVERDQLRTQNYNLQEELERVGMVRKDFMTIMSHEFRTALTGIQGFSEMMRDEELSLMEMKEFAVDIFTDARRLVRLISEMMEIHRVESERIHLIKSWLDLNAIIIDAVSRARTEDSNHIFRLQLANALPVMPGDYEKLNKIVFTLLRNAIKHSPHGGEISLSSQVEGNTVHIAVRDHGVGIATVDLERIFEQSSRAQTASIHSREEAELRLPQIREIIQLHNGQIWIESLIGKGTVVHFTLPFIEVPQ